MAKPFTFLSVREFDHLGYEEKLLYLKAAMAETKRTKGSKREYRWDDLFTHGPFISVEYAHASAEWAASRLIDKQGK